MYYSQLLLISTLVININVLVSEN